MGLPVRFSGLSGEKIVFAKVSTSNPKNSFFSALSSSIKGTLVLNVIPLPSRREYIVIAKPSSEVTRDLIRGLGTIRERSKVERLRVVRSGRHTYILALKSRCEFYEISESNNVAVLSPYRITYGTREFYVAGSPERVSRYLEELSSYYGPGRVSAHLERGASRVPVEIEGTLIGTVLWGLTDREIEVLRAAYSSGFLSHRRHVKMDYLVNYLGIKKSTLSIMIRKALSKLLEELLEYAS